MSGLEASLVFLAGLLLFGAILTMGAALAVTAMYRYENGR
jgi:hypothetical protein